MERQETQNVIKSFAQSVEGGNEIGMAFKSYARLLQAKTMCLCDKECFMIFNGEFGFHRDKYKKVYWKELEDPDVFNVVKNVLM